MEVEGLPTICEEQPGSAPRREGEPPHQPKKKQMFKAIPAGPDEDAFKDAEEEDILELLKEFPLADVSPKAQSSHFKAACRMLLAAVSSLHFSGCVDDSASKRIRSFTVAFAQDTDLGLRLCINAGRCAEAWKLQAKTAQRHFGLVRKLLISAGCRSSQAKKLRLCPRESDLDRTIPGSIAKLGPEHPVYQLVKGWSETLLQTTKNKSYLSRRNIINFFVSRIVGSLGVDLNTWSETVVDGMKAKITTEWIESMCHPDKQASRQVHWVQIFLTDILQSTFIIDKRTVKMMRQKTENALEPDADDDGSDHHRISSADLDKMFYTGITEKEHKLYFYLMLSTGMRIDGLVHIRVKSVAVQLPDGTWNAKKSGSTVQKGNKVLKFVIADYVRKLIVGWLTFKRPYTTSPYLFPGLVKQHVSTATIRKYFNSWCLKAGLRKKGPEGKQYHPHSLRHSYGHLMLAAGNSIESVSKLLNHKTPAVTAKFYLKKSFEEEMADAIIPWRPEPDDEDTQTLFQEPLPKCLRELITTNAVKRQNDADTRKRKREDQARAFESLDVAIKQ